MGEGVSGLATKVTARLLRNTVEISSQEVYEGKVKPAAPDAGIGGNRFRIVSRAKAVIREYASANPWEWFVTITLDPEKVDRSTPEPLQAGMQQFNRYARRKTGELSAYLAVPEQHPNGWGFHGHALAHCPEAVLVPYQPSEYNALPFAIKKAYSRAKEAGRQIYHCPWMDAQLGWNLWEPVSSPDKICNYIIKYITKAFEGRSQTGAGAARAGSTPDPDCGRATRGKSLYYASRGLKRAPKRVLKPTQNTYKLLETMEQLRKDVLYWGDGIIGGNAKCKTRAWCGVREYNGKIVGTVYRVDRENVSPEDWEKILKLAGLDPVSLAVLESEYGE